MAKGSPIRKYFKRLDLREKKKQEEGSPFALSSLPTSRDSMLDPKKEAMER